jgi:hypothetical protein
MKTHPFITAVLLSSAACLLIPGCAQEDLDHFYGLDAQPGQQQNYQSGGTDSFYAEQNAKREANQRAVQEQNYRNQMQNYQNGYSNTLPNY